MNLSLAKQETFSGVTCDFYREDGERLESCMELEQCITRRGVKLNGKQFWSERLIPYTGVSVWLVITALTLTIKTKQGQVIDTFPLPDVS